MLPRLITIRDRLGQDLAAQLTSDAIKAICPDEQCPDFGHVDPAWPMARAISMNVVRTASGLIAPESL